MEKFIDVHTITLSSGDGAAGSVSFRREKYVAKGGPDGGDGGKGGDIILFSNKKVSSFINIYSYKKIKADNGSPGIGRKKHGKNGQDVVINVPIGTLIKDTNDKIIFDFNKDNVSFALLKGGLGGKGNTHFATATNQAPQYAQKGLPGQTATVKLEIKLIADIGLVGLPNVGKSTFISVITNAKPKIANYPFTTLKPELGILKLDDFTSLIIADIPGIIPDAHKGKGLGLDFLRHIERTRIIFFIIEAISEDPYDDLKKLRLELKEYSEVLYKKNFIIGISKLDLLGNNKIKNTFPKKYQDKIFLFSSITHNGIDKIKKKCYSFIE